MAEISHLAVDTEKQVGVSSLCVAASLYLARVI